MTPTVEPSPRGFGRPEKKSRTFRATSSAFTFWAVIAGLVLVVVDLIARGRWDILVPSLPLILLIAWAFWLVLWHTSILVTGDRVEVINFARVHELPWPRISDVQLRAQVSFTLDTGAVVNSWGGPFPKRRQRPDEPDAAGEMMRMRVHRDSDVAPRTYWQWPILAVGGVLAVVCLVQLVFLLT